VANILTSAPFPQRGMYLQVSNIQQSERGCADTELLLRSPHYSRCTFPCPQTSGHD